MKFLLNKKDFKFIEEFRIKHHIPLGEGKVTTLEYMLNEYKQYMRNDKSRKVK